MLVRHVLDSTLGQGVEEALGKLFRDRNRSRDWPDDSNLDRIPDTALDEVIVKQERPLERRGRALEWVAEDPDQDLPRVEVREHVAHALRARDRVELAAALFESGRGCEVVIRSQRDDEDVGFVRGCVCRHLPFLRVDRDHPLLSELDSLFGDVAVVQQDVRCRLPAEQDVQLREPEAEGVVLVEKRDTDLAREGLGESRRQFQARETCTKDHDVLHRLDDDNAHDVELRPSQATRRGAEQAKPESPLTDSNRRPPPYHGGSGAVLAGTVEHARARLSCNRRFEARRECPRVPARDRADVPVSYPRGVVNSLDSKQRLGRAGRQGRREYTGGTPRSLVFRV